MEERKSFYKREDEIGELCSVCGYDLSEIGKIDQICPCCGIQFNYDDAFGRDAFERFLIHHGFRCKWIKDGMSWSSKAVPLPEGWDAQLQLSKIQNKKAD